MCRYTTVEISYESYAHAAFDIINFPSKFILSQLFEDFWMNVYNALSGQSNKKRFALMGPKGVGKSTFLVVLWCELLKKNFSIILTSDKAAMSHNTSPVKKYTKEMVKDDKNLLAIVEDMKSPQDYVNFLHEYIAQYCETKSKQVVLLLDVCHFNENNQAVISNLLQLVHSHTRLISIVAFSSGIGSQVSARVDQYLQSAIQCFLLSGDTQCIHLQHYTKAEAELALNLNETTLKVEDIEHITSYNPLLLSLTKSCGDINELRRRVNYIVKAFLDSNFVDEYSFLPQLYYQSLENSVWFFYVAQSGIEMNIEEELEVFEQSWIAKQNICYILSKCNNTFTIKLNFPTLPNALQSDLSLRLKEGNKMPLNEIKGYLFENAFFEYLQQSPQVIEIFTSKSDAIIRFNVSSTYHSKEKVLQGLNDSVIYRLRHLHPAIDGVGILYDTHGTKWLVFLQLSISRYQTHRSKIKHLFQDLKTSKTAPPELLIKRFLIIIRAAERKAMKPYICIYPQQRCMKMIIMYYP